MGNRQLPLIVLMLVFLNADQMVMAPNIGEISREFGVGDMQIGLVASTFTILGALVSLVWGYLSDRYNRKNLLIFSILVGEIPAFMTAFSRSFGELFLWRTLTGLGVGASFPISHSMIGDMYERKRRAKAAAALSIAVSIGGITGMMVGGYLGAIAGWRIPFIAVSVPNFFLAILALFVLREPPRGIKEDEIADLVESGVTYPVRPKLSDYAKLFKIKTNLLLFLQGIAGTVPWGAIPYYLVEFLKRERGMGTAEATTVFLAFGVGNVVGTILGGYIGEAIYRRSKKGVPLFMGITTGLGVLATVAVFTVPMGPYAVAISGAMAAVLVSLTGPNVKMLLLNVNEPGDRGRIFSVFNLTDSLGTGIGKYFGGAVSEMTGSLGKALTMSANFWIICSALLLSLVAFVERDVENLSKRMRELRREMSS